MILAQLGPTGIDGMALMIPILAIVLSLSLPIVVAILLARSYMKHRAMENAERLAMIEKGMELDLSKKQDNRRKGLRTPLAFAGAGLGLVVGLLSTSGLGEDSAAGYVLAAILLGLGVGLLAGTVLDNKAREKDRKESLEA